jgi:hypothetical protein
MLRLIGAEVPRPGPRPQKGTPEYKLWIEAIEVALAAPMHQNENAYAAKIPWSRIHKLRAALEGVGIDWKAAKEVQDGPKPERSYQRHEPSGQREYEPDGDYLCTCGARQSFLIPMQAWMCSALGRPTAAFDKIPPPEEHATMDHGAEP